VHDLVKIDENGHTLT